jgi:hypothetical protein
LLKSAEIFNQEHLKILFEHPSLDSLNTFLRALESTHFLTKDFFMMASRIENTNSLYNIFSFLPTGILSKDNIPIILKHQNLNELESAMLICRVGRFLNTLNKESLQSLIICKHPENLAKAYAFLNRSDLLNQENVKLVANHQTPLELAEMMHFLKSVNLLNESNQKKIINHPNLKELLYNCKVLNFEKILNQLSFQDIAEHEKPVNLTEALIILNMEKLLNEERRKALLQTSDPSELARTFALLNRNNILTADNYNRVVQHGVIKNLLDVVQKLHSEALLTQERFLNVLNNPSLLTDNIKLNFWNILPPHLIRENWATIIEISRGQNSEARLIRFAARLLNPDAETMQETINPMQSTHTASVHQSVSESAQKLMQRYGKKLDIEKTMKEMTAYIVGLDDKTQEQEAAKRAIVRLNEPSYTFEDPGSKVSTLQLLALFWTAIQDEKNRICTLEDGKKLLIQALYEIQRGYNLNNSSQDQGGDDRQICAAGTFNKLIEKLQGMHPDAEIQYITKATASAKFPLIVKKRALEYFEKSSEEERAQFLKIPEITDKLWDKIKDVVIKDMQEFKLAFTNNDELANFININKDYIEFASEELSKINSNVSRLSLFSSSSSSSSSSSFNEEKQNSKKI